MTTPNRTDPRSEPELVKFDGRTFAVFFGHHLEAIGVHARVGAAGGWRLLWRCSWFDAIPVDAIRAIAAAEVALTRAGLQLAAVFADLPSVRAVPEDCEAMWAWIGRNGGEDRGNEADAPDHIAEALVEMPGWRFLGPTRDRYNALMFHDEAGLWMMLDATEGHQSVAEIVELGRGMIEEFGGG